MPAKVYQLDRSNLHQWRKKAQRAKGQKKTGKHQYDDETLANMVRYYNLGENYESLLRYIKRRGLVDGDSEQ